MLLDAGGVEHKLNESAGLLIFRFNQLFEEKLCGRDLAHLLQGEKLIVADELPSMGVILDRAVSGHVPFGVTALKITGRCEPLSKRVSATERCVYPPRFVKGYFL